MRRVLILGATGSIGTTCLDAIRSGKLEAEVTGLVARHSNDRLESLSREFGCPCLINDSHESLVSFIRDCGGDIALNGIAGSAGLAASLACLDAGLDLALANKESIVMGGDFLLDEARRLERRIIPVDSEHSAIYNLLKGHQGEVSSLVITASGGPFLDRQDLENVTPDEAATHPTWKMGRKISIDSSTLANKGLEVIEAGFLFGIDADRIEVTIHRQSIVHSMIRLENGAIYAQLSPPDMTLPIVAAVNDEYARLTDVVRPLSFNDLTLTFHSWSPERFPLLALAYKVLERKAGYPIAYNAADEIAVSAFIEGRIRYTDIARVVSATLEKDWSHTACSYDEIVDIDSMAREVAAGCLSSL